MAVTGDWGNWIFCREFHPAADERVSDHYWCEKLGIASTQESKNYSKEKTRAEIEERLKEEDLDPEDKDFLTELLDVVDDEEEGYRRWAYENMPRDFDAESLPLCYENKFWLKAIFDAFDEICARMASGVQWKEDPSKISIGLIPKQEQPCGMCGGSGKVETTNDRGDDEVYNCTCAAGKKEVSGG